MDPVTAIIALISAAEKAALLARTLTQAKKRADEEGRQMTAAEVRAFRDQAVDSIALLDQAIAEAEAAERG